MFKCARVCMLSKTNIRFECDLIHPCVSCPHILYLIYWTIKIWTSAWVVEKTWLCILDCCYRNYAYTKQCAKYQPSPRIALRNPILFWIYSFLFFFHRNFFMESISFVVRGLIEHVVFPLKEAHTTNSNFKNKFSWIIENHLNHHWKKSFF